MEVSEFIACEDMCFLGQTAKTRKALGGGTRVGEAAKNTLDAYIFQKETCLFFVFNVSVDLLDLHLAQLPKYSKISSAANSLVSHL